MLRPLDRLLAATLALAFASGCSDIAPSLTSLGLQITNFGVVQGDREDGFLLVNATTRKVHFEINCVPGLKTLEIRYAGVGDFKPVTDLDCVSTSGTDNGFISKLLAKAGKQSSRASVEFTLPDLILNAEGQSVNLPRIPYEIRATGPELTSSVVHGVFVAGTFEGGGLRINNGSQMTNSLSVLVAPSGRFEIDGESFPISEAYVTAQPGCTSGGSWTDAGSGQVPGVLALPNNDNHLYARFRDLAGNESDCFSSSILHDDIPPVAQSVLINNGAPQTLDANVNLLIQASGDVAQMKLTLSSDCSGAGAWQNYVTTRAVTLPGPGANSVSVRFRDLAGNESACVADEIIWDNSPPETPNSLSFAPGYKALDHQSPVLIRVSPVLRGDTAELYTDAACTQKVASAMAGPGGFAEVPLTPENEGSVTVWASVIDLGLTQSPCSSVSLTYTYDATVPTITNLTSLAANGEYSSGQSLQIDVTLSESVVVTGIPQLVIALYGGATALAPLVSASGANLSFQYTVGSNDASTRLDSVGAGAIQLGTATIQDSAGNPLNPDAPSGTGTTGALAFNKNLTVNTLVGIRKIYPPMPGHYFTSDPLDFVVEWTGPVVISGGTPQLKLQAGTAAISATYQSALSQPRFSVFRVNSPNVEALSGVATLTSPTGIVNGTIRNQFNTADASRNTTTQTFVDVKTLSGATATVGFTASLYEFAEDDGAVSLPIELSRSLPVDTVVRYEVLQRVYGATLDDHDLRRGQVTIPAGQTNTSIPFNLVNDNLVEGTEIFHVVLSGASAGAIDPSRQLTEVVILDDDLQKPVITSMSLGSSHFCYVTDVGALFCQGSDNEKGQIGHGSATLPKTPARLFASGAQKVVTQGNTNCAIVDFRLYCWGENTNARTGVDNSVTVVNTPTLVSRFSEVHDVAFGSNFTCIIQGPERRLQCWGYQGNGQLANGQTSGVVITAQNSTASTATDVDSISLGTSHGCLIRQSQEIRCWGNNYYGQLGTGNSTMATQPVAITLPAGETPMALQLTSSKSCYLSATGDVFCWGFGNYLGNGSASHLNTVPSTPTSLPDLAIEFIPVDSSTTYSAVRLADGRVFSWNSTADPVERFNLNPAATRSAAYVGADPLSGNLSASIADLLSPAEPTSIIRPVPALRPDLADLQVYDNNNGCLLSQMGEVSCWGFKTGTGLSPATYSYPVAQIGRSYSKIAVGGNISCGIRADKSLWCWGRRPAASTGTDPITVPFFALADVESVQTGSNHLCALTLDKDLYCWGANSINGQIGDGTSTNRAGPVKILSGVDQFSVGQNHSCARIGTGVKCWGYNGNGNLGDLSGIPQLSPVDIFLISPDLEFRDIQAGTNHTCVVTTDNRLGCWGANSFGQLGRGNTTQLAFLLEFPGSQVSTMKVGYNATCMTQTNDESRCWGQYSGVSSANQTSVPSTPLFTTPVSLSPGAISCVTSPTDVQCWGARNAFWSPSTSASPRTPGYWP